MGHFWTDKNGLAWETHIRIESVTAYYTGATFDNAKSIAHKHATKGGLIAVDKRWNMEEKRHDGRRARQGSKADIPRCRGQF